MPKVKPKLTETAIKNAKPKSKDYKLYDEAGLLLLVRVSGTKVWQLPYKFAGKYNLYTIGKYPEIGSAEARKLRDEIKALIKQGINPNQRKKIEKRILSGEGGTTFETVAREWHGKQIWAEKHSKNILSRLEKDVFENIGYKQIDAVSPQDILSVLYGIEDRGAIDVAKRINQYCVAIFEYAINKGLCDHNPAIGRAKVLKNVKTEHRRYLTDKELPEFIERLENYGGGKRMKLAVKLLLLTFVRPKELRFAVWGEFNIDKAEWHITSGRMKMKSGHIVPLSTQALAVLKEIKDINGKGDLLFPGERKPSQPITEEALIKMFQLMGYTGDNKFRPHGIRGTASTILNGNGFKSDVIERQLSHIERNKVRAAYNHAEYMPERHELMQWWGDYLDKMKG